MGKTTEPSAKKLVLSFEPDTEPDEEMLESCKEEDEELGFESYYDREKHRWVIKGDADAIERYIDEIDLREGQYTLEEVGVNDSGRLEEPSAELLAKVEDQLARIGFNFEKKGTTPFGRVEYKLDSREDDYHPLDCDMTLEFYTKGLDAVKDMLKKEGSSLTYNISCNDRHVSGYCHVDRVFKPGLARDEKPALVYMAKEDVCGEDIQDKDYEEDISIYPEGWVNRETWEEFLHKAKWPYWLSWEQVVEEQESVDPSKVKYVETHDEDPRLSKIDKLIADEQDAIRSYEAAMDCSSEADKAIYSHIIEEELEHIQELKNLKTAMVVDSTIKMPKTRTVWYVFNGDDGMWGPFGSVEAAKKQIEKNREFDEEHGNHKAKYRIEREDAPVYTGVLDSIECNEALRERVFDEITGANGTLGDKIKSVLSKRGFKVKSCRTRCDSVRVNWEYRGRVGQIVLTGDKFNDDARRAAEYIASAMQRGKPSAHPIDDSVGLCVRVAEAIRKDKPKANARSIVDEALSFLDIGPGDYSIEDLTKIEKAMFDAVKVGDEEIDWDMHYGSKHPWDYVSLFYEDGLPVLAARGAPRWSGNPSDLDPPEWDSEWEDFYDGEFELKFKDEKNLQEKAYEYLKELIKQDNSPGLQSKRELMEKDEAEFKLWFLDHVDDLFQYFEPQLLEYFKDDASDACSQNLIDNGYWEEEYSRYDPDDYEF